MTEDNSNKMEVGEEILWKMRPSWRSHFVWFLGIAVCVGGPLLSTQSPLSPTWGFVLGAIFLVIIIRRRSNFYTLTDRKLYVDGGMFGKDTRSIHLPDIVDIEINQGVALKIMRSGHLLIRSGKPDEAPLIMFGLNDPYDFRRWLTRVIEDAQGTLGSATIDAGSNTVH